MQCSGKTLVAIPHSKREPPDRSLHLVTRWASGAPPTPHLGDFWGPRGGLASHSRGACSAGNDPFRMCCGCKPFHGHDFVAVSYPQGRVRGTYYPHVRDGRPEAQSSEVTCVRSHSRRAAGPPDTSALPALRLQGTRQPFGKGAVRGRASCAS